MLDIESSPILTSASFGSGGKEGGGGGEKTLMQSLNSDKLILPGSDLQQAIALSMEGTKLQPGISECVICMDVFDEFNPIMLTLCGCGMNKTQFHYNCLLEWISKDTNCPACRDELLWEERTLSTSSADVDVDSDVDSDFEGDEGDGVEDSVEE